jgi:hypothetical protein
LVVDAGREDAVTAQTARDRACARRRTTAETDTINRAINAASERARELVLEHASRFDGRADYAPLEDLAADVQRAVVVTAAGVLREAAP